MTVQPTPIQPQDRRPKRAAERARTRRQKAKDAEAVGMRIDGVEYVINPHDLTGRVEREIRNELGMSLSGLQERLNGPDAGLDYVGMFMWAVRYANGEDPILDEVLDEIRADSEFEIIKAEDVAGAAGPKASARSASPRSRPSRPSSA